MEIILHTLNLHYTSRGKYGAYFIQRPSGKYRSTQVCENEVMLGTVSLNAFVSGYKDAKHSKRYLPTNYQNDS